MSAQRPGVVVLPPTSAVLQRHLHGAPPLALPAAAGRRRALHLLGIPPLPQVDLQTVVEQEQGCKGGCEISGNARDNKVELDYLDLD